MTSSLCKDCISGVRHEGTPTGKIEQINGVDVYVAIPSGEYAKNKALLYIPDAMGVVYPNAQLLADDFAINGIQVYIIDVFNGDSVPVKVVEEKNSNFDIIAWVQKHNEQVTRPYLNTVIEGLKERGIKEFGATGYCFGGKYVVNLAQENVVKVGAVSHPSLLELPGDLEKLFANSRAPLLINSCDYDKQFPPEACALADKLFEDGKYTPGYKRAHWEGCTHGFAVRGDLNDPKTKIGKEGAFLETVSWMKQYL